MKGSKMLSMLVVFALVLSSLIVSNVTAERHVELVGSNAQWIISNNGFGTLADNLTCGEIITLQITNNSLPKNTNYRVLVWNGSSWCNLTTVGNRQSDMYGDLSISFRVPGWGELGKNPVKENGTNVTGVTGQWNVSLFSNNYSTQIFADLNVTIKIGNLYYLKFYEGSTEINNLVYNKEYSAFQVKIFNWTGSQLVEAKGDKTKYKFDISLCNYSNNPPGEKIESLGTNKTDGVSDTKGVLIDNTIITQSDKEKTLWVRVDHSDNSSFNSIIALPVLLDVTQTSTLTNLKWGDSFTVSGKVLDGQGTGLKNYEVRIYYPVSGGYGYDETTTPSTVTTGTYSLPFETGSEKGFGAGTWYVGTYYAGGVGRVNKNNQPPYIPGFIPYYSFEVGTKDTATVTVHSPDELTRGFWQTVNVSVKNESWMTDEFKNMNIHITGLKGWDGTRAYNRSDIALLSVSASSGSDTRWYYEFKYMFNETGTATILVSWPGNLTAFDYHDSSYTNTYGNHSTSLIANITGETTVSVVSPGAMTVIVNNPPEKVEVESDFEHGWVNKSTAWTNISVYGINQSTYKNATIKVSGCGLDFTINESDSTHKYLNKKGFDETGNGSWYNLSIIPKTAGTLTITVTNGTDTVTKDYTVKGLTGTVTTSIGDDLEITVGTTETITLSGVNQYAEVTVTFFDESWGSKKRLNYSEEAGQFSFTPDADDINKIGYIVVVAGITAWDLYMYDIIEVVPVDDLQLNVLTPTEGNQTLTVGMEQEVIIELLDPNGDPVTEDEPKIECKLIDDDHDWDNYLQNFTGAFTPIGDGQWEATILPWTAGQLVIKGYNASEGIKHIGTNTLDVDYATITYSPEGTTAGIEIENLTVAVTAKDANGNPLDVSTLYLWAENATGGLEFDKTVTLTDGAGEFVIKKVGDLKTHINATLQDNKPDEGNRTLGKFNIGFPYFDVDPDEIYINEANTVTIYAYDFNRNQLPKRINLTLYGNPIKALDPQETDEDGKVVFSVEPTTGGKVNVTIARDVKYVGGVLTWDLNKSVITDTYITVTSRKTMTIDHPSIVEEGEKFTVEALYNGNRITDRTVTITFAGETYQTTDGVVEITAPTVTDTYDWKIIANAKGYTKDVTSWIKVINKPNLYISITEKEWKSGTKYVVKPYADDGAYGITVTLKDSSGTVVDAQIAGPDGATFTAPKVDKKTTYTITATKTGYIPADDVKITVEPAGIPGFELLTLVAAIGVAFILLRRRRK